MPLIILCFSLFVIQIMVFSIYTRQRILNMHWKGYKVSAIVEHLVLEDQIVVSKQGVWQFIKHYRQCGTIARKPGSGLPPKLSPAIQQLIEQTMQQDDETSVTQLQAKLASLGIYVSLATIVHNRVQLGWTYCGSAYCQLIRQQNKEKRLEWAQMYLHDNFDNVIFSDETTVQLETHRRHCYRKLGEKPRPKPRAKHPTKVHVWAGISRRGATQVCIFEGIMTAPLKFFSKPLSPSSKNTFLLLPALTDSCRIMILNTLLVQPNSSIWTLELIGGKRLLSLQIWTP